MIISAVGVVSGLVLGAATLRAPTRGALPKPVTAEPGAARRWLLIAGVGMLLAAAVILVAIAVNG
jgi:hypothetical protein